MRLPVRKSDANAVSRYSRSPLLAPCLLRCLEPNSAPGCRRTRISADSRAHVTEYRTASKPGRRPRI